MSDSFLSRWSRRKEEAHRAERGSEPKSVEAAALRSDAQQHARNTETLASEPDLTPKEIAELPKIDELTAESDITGFLRPGVPEVLRNAALRRMWMLDPAIRDFVGHARDYAYDWNTPGGVPGSGALLPGDDVAAMVRSIFGDSEPDTASSQSTDGNPQDRHVMAVRSGDEAPAAAVQQKTAYEDGGSADSERKTEGSPGEGETVTDFVEPQ